MTRTTPWRLITLHLSHSFFTDARTFMAIILVLNSNSSAGRKPRLEPSNLGQQLQNPASRPVRHRQRHSHPVANPQPHKIGPLGAGQVSHKFVLSLQPDPHQRTGKQLDHDRFGDPLSPRVRHTSSGPRQDPGTVIRHGDHVFKVRRKRSVFRHSSPAIGEHLGVGFPGVHHRLNREHHPRF